MDSRDRQKSTERQSFDEVKFPSSDGREAEYRQEKLSISNSSVSASLHNRILCAVRMFSSTNTRLRFLPEEAEVTLVFGYVADFQPSTQEELERIGTELSISSYLNYYEVENFSPSEINMRIRADVSEIVDQLELPIDLPPGLF